MRWSRQFVPGSNDHILDWSRESREYLKKSTLKNELGHWAFLLILGYASLENLQVGDFGKAGIASLFNFIINGYPILLQRYKRGIIEKREKGYSARK